MNKKRFLILPIALAFIGQLASCSLAIDSSKTTSNTNITINPDSSGSYTITDPETKGDYKVIFVCNNGYSYESYTDKNNKIIKPTNPEKIYSEFLGWYSDSEYKKSFDFNTSVSEDTVLYAKFQQDYISLINEASINSMLGNVRILVENYNISGFNRKTNESSSLGSGAIIYETQTYYYCLTNHHVVYKEQNYQNITIEDAYETSYTAEIVCKDVAYDLALLRFKKGKTSLNVLPLANYEVNTNEFVIAIGEPEGLSNTISLGYTLSSMVFTPDSDTIAMSNVTFSVYRHSAPINSGSSGGILLDSNLKLIGINFASAVDQETNEYKYSYTIPATKVREFLDKYVQITI